MIVIWFIKIVIPIIFPCVFGRPVNAATNVALLSFELCCEATSCIRSATPETTTTATVASAAAGGTTSFCLVAGKMQLKVSMLYIHTIYIYI